MRILETERLHLREFTLDDTSFIIELLNTPGWLKYIGERNVKTKEQAVAYLTNGPMKSYVENGYGLFMVELKNHTPVGMCGIIKRPHLDHPDIGFAFLPQYIGQGYAFEIAEATLTYAKNKLHLSTIFAITLPNNSSSIRLIEKLGLVFVKSYIDNNEELFLYRRNLATDR